MAHPKLIAMHDQVLQVVREPAGASLIFISARRESDHTRFQADATDHL